MKKINNWFIIIFFIFLFILIRSVNFTQHLNFSSDQASSSLRILEIWKNKEITLIGPSISFHFIGRDLYFGSITYYFQLIFLLLTRFDPIAGSYLFMIFAALMIIPLYYGALILTSYYGALFTIAIYTLTPIYIDYTRFFWNPNYQLALTPTLILLFSLFHKFKKTYLLFLTGFLAGLLLLFHYQYFVIVACLTVYFLFVKKVGFKKILIFIFGTIAGLSPMIIFELRNNFYNLQTLFLYIKNYREVFFNKNGSLAVNPHYFLSIGLFLLLIIDGYLAKYFKGKVILIMTIILIIFGFTLYGKIPSHGFGMINNWNYPMELKTYQIIKNEKLENVNIVHLGYDTNATVQKFLLTKDNYQGLAKDYYNNRYLFVINEGDDYMSNPAYEVNTFIPSKIVKKWTINKIYQLYLLERINEKNN